jgi:release factor glutamine methyltransferase
MTLIEYKSYFRQKLSYIYKVEESDDLLKRIIKAYFNWEPVKFGLEPNYVISKKEEECLNSALKELKKEKPLQYILGFSLFMDLKFEVNTSVLIPRPETEELVEWIVSDEKLIRSKEVLDIGTGSGCIAITLKHLRSRLHVSALDISTKAIEVAENNARNNSVKVQFHQADILTKKNWITPLDIIVSNPPYVLPSEKKQMKTNVLGYEPKLALFAPEDDPLLFYKKITEFAKQNLKSRGALYFEINPIFVDELSLFLNENSFDSIEVRNDFHKLPRMVKALRGNK